MSIHAKNKPDSLQLLNGEIGSTVYEHVVALKQALDYASKRTFGQPAFFENLPKKVIQAIQANPVYHGEEIDVVDIVANHSRRNRFLAVCEELVRPPTIVYPGKEQANESRDRKK